MPDTILGATNVNGKRRVLVTELKISDDEVRIKVPYKHVYEWMNINCLLWAMYCLGTVKFKIMLPCNKREDYVLNYLDVRN